MSAAVFAHCVDPGRHDGCGQAFTEAEWKALPDHGPRDKGGRARRCTRCGFVFTAYPWLRDRPTAPLWEGDAAT